MPPRTSVTTSPSRNNTPYARRPSTQPKSSRQQFSACGACRMRRVRCDLKDLPFTSSGPLLACSNCKERGINCVDEFADVKAVKLLRRGRRLQQVEAIYGKTQDQDDSSTSPDTASRMASSIPTLHSDLFSSPFWRWFTVQRPILDPIEFPARHASHCKRTQDLGEEVDLIAIILVAWAESFGLNERGEPHLVADRSASTSDGAQPYTSPDPFVPQETTRVEWRNKVEVYLKEILELVDYHSILRRPSLDGLRALLLLLPLMDEAPTLERSAIHEAALSQVQALCVQTAPASTNFEEAAVRARLFWYAYTQEGLLTGLRGQRFVLTDEDFETFLRTLPSPHFGVSPAGLPTPPSTSNSRDGSVHKNYLRLLRASSTPLDLSKICRNIHMILTGSKAARRAEQHCLVDANGMREIWRDLDKCWQDLDSMMCTVPEEDSTKFELSQYIHAWQIFIFECHNVIREALKRFMVSARPHSSYVDDSRPPSSSPYLTPQHLHLVATRRCTALLPTVVRIFRLHLSTKYVDVSGIFRWDAGLVRDGCFYAGYLAACSDSDILQCEEKNEDRTTPIMTEEAVLVCLDALTAMKWGYSRSEEREESIRLIWENRKMKLQSQGSSESSSPFDLEHPASIPFATTPNPITLSASNLLSTSHIPRLPSLFHRPISASSMNGRDLNGWATYTPPGTATSIATSAGTGLSAGEDSPIFANMPPFKTSADDLYYQTSGSEMDQFSYNPPLTAGSLENETNIPSTIGRYPLRQPSSDMHAQTSNSSVNYMASNFHANSSILTDFQSSCLPFGETSVGSY